MLAYLFPATTEDFLVWIHTVARSVEFCVCVLAENHSGEKDIDGAETGRNGAPLMIKKKDVR